jgi:hypothetical protein
MSLGQRIVVHMGPTSFIISCDDCVMQHTSACEDCVVTFLCDREPDEGILIDADEARAVRLLSGAGLAPRLRHVRKTG